MLRIYVDVEGNNKFLDDDDQENAKQNPDADEALKEEM